MVQVSQSYCMSVSKPSPAQDAAFTDAYNTLRSLADSFLRRNANAGTLQATALVHEAYLKLAVEPRTPPSQTHTTRCVRWLTPSCAAMPTPVRCKPRRWYTKPI